MANTKTTKEKKSKTLDAAGNAVIAFSIIYIIAELTFNLGLIDFLSSKNTEMDTFHTLEMFGRALSSLGIALFLSKIVLLFKKADKIWSYGVFALSLVIVFAGQTFIFNKILDNMTQEQKLNAYAFGVYRNLNLNEQTSLKVLNGEDKTYDEVVNSMFGLFTTVPQVETNIVNSVKGFFKAENTMDINTLGKIYDEINFTLPNIDEYWKLYYIESRRYENYRGLFQKQYRQNFEKSVGMPPSLSKVEFEKRLKGASSSIQEFNKVVLIPANTEFKMPALHLGDIPEGLNKQQWISFVTKHIDTAIEKSSFSAKNVDGLPHSRNIISSVVITPIAVVLSLVALFMNIVLFVARWSKIGAGIVFAAILGLTFTSGSYNPYKFNPNINYFIGLETKVVNVFGFYKNIIHSLFVNDNNPNPYKIIKIEKPKLPDMGNLKKELDSKFKELRSTGNTADGQNSQAMQTFNNINQQIKVDDQRMTDPNYYGEIRKANPYVQ